MGESRVLVEQNHKFATGICEKLVVIENGHAVEEIARADFATSERKIMEYLGV